MSKIIGYKEFSEFALLEEGDIWIEKHGTRDFKAFLLTREEPINSHNPAKSHKTSKEALRSLRRGIRREIISLESKIKLIDLEL